MYKILVIEDNADVRDNMAEILELANYKVFTAANGKEGVDVAIKELPDLVVCDIMMPVLDGYGVLHLLNRNTATAAIPFIFLTAKSEKGDFRKGMEMGADDYITKPFEGIELLDAVEIRLKKKEALKKQFKTALATLDDLNNATADRNKVTLVNDSRAVYDYSKKAQLYSEGQKPKAVYYLVKGKIKTYMTHSDGKELITNIYTAGSFFGYLPIIEGTNYKDNAQVLEECQVLLIPKDEFLGLMSEDMQITKQFVKLLSADIYEKEEQLLNMAFSSLRKKVAFGLVQSSEKFSKKDAELPFIQLSRENLANSIGIATESLIRTLADFKAEKLIEIDGQIIRILKEEKLRNLLY